MIIKLIGCWKIWFVSNCSVFCSIHEKGTNVCLFISVCNILFQVTMYKTCIFRKEMSTMKTCILIYNKMYGVHPIMLLNFVDKNKDLIFINC